VVVGKGTGASQSFIDTDGMRRQTIFDGLTAGTPPVDILADLALLPGHETRQYGIADTNGDAITFSGSSNFPFADGVTGSSGSLHYAIQGNLLTGAPVLTAIEQAVLTTVGDFPAKLMAGMEAARVYGGDGRCSCPGPDPTACGAPPPSFTNSAINGGMIVARIGDTDDPLCEASGCADGDYFMTLNVAAETYPSTDPVLQLQTLFDAFRTGLEGRPDAIRSRVEFAPGAGGTTAMIITLLDWRGIPITSLIASLVVQHAADSDGLATIGTAIDHGDGTFSVELSTGPATGFDRFTVIADDGIRPVTLMPASALQYVAIDVHPGNLPNSVNPASKGVIPVALLTTAAFDATDVDPSSVVLGSGEATDAHGRVHLEDIDDDGDDDVMLHFRTQDSGIVCGDTAVSLTGQTFDGRSIGGSDSINTVGCL
jgi:hypothetical protein